ncbi:OmpA family protein [Kribbella endophytica]
MKISLHLVTAAGVGALLVGISACGGGDPAQPSGPPANVAVVVSTHRNAPKVTKSAVLGKLPALMTGSRLVLVGVDGNRAGTEVFDQEIAAGSTKQETADNISQAKITLGNKVEEAVATSAESDPLAAIAAAARKLKGVPGDKTLIVADSLLSTSGALRLQQLGFGWTAEDIYEQLSSQKPSNIPDLTGFTVKVIALGATRPPQQPLDEARLKQLQQLWELIFVKAHAKVEVTFPGVGQEDSKSSHKVSVIAVEPPQAPVVPKSPCAEFVIPETVVRFKPDTAEFLDRDAADAAADRVAQAMRDCPGSLKVTGTTSSAGTEEGRKRVSTDRALAFRAVLAQAMQVPSESITAVGVGIHFPGFRRDRDRYGNLVPSLAILNRTVRVTAVPDGR